MEQALGNPEGRPPRPLRAAGAAGAATMVLIYTLGPEAAGLDLFGFIEHGTWLSRAISASMSTAPGCAPWPTMAKGSSASCRMPASRPTVPHSSSAGGELGRVGFEDVHFVAILTKRPRASVCAWSVPDTTTGAGRTSAARDPVADEWPTP